MGLILCMKLRKEEIEEVIEDYVNKLGEDTDIGMDCEQVYEGNPKNSQNPIAAGSGSISYKDIVNQRDGNWIECFKKWGIADLEEEIPDQEQSEEVIEEGSNEI